MKYTNTRNNQQGIAHIALALIAIVIVGVAGSGYVVYKAHYKAVNSDMVASKNSKASPAPIIVSVPAPGQTLSTGSQSTAPAATGTTNKTTASAPAATQSTTAAPAQPSPVTQYTSIPEWGIKVPLVSMTATNLGASLVVYYRLGITDSKNNPVAFFFGSSEVSLSEDEGCSAGQVASVYVFRDTTDSDDTSDASQLTLYKKVAVGGHTYNIYRMLCHDGDWTLDYNTFNVADHLAQMVAS